MKIFISWSGIVSKKIAEALRQWIPGVIQAARPYYSPDDISKGSRWSSEIAKELDNSKVGVICLTKDNLQAPWIMFEAGALSKNIEISKVCPMLFGVEPSDIQGPLVQFQAARFSKEEVKKVIRMINVELGENALAPDVLDSVFEMWWPKLKEAVDSIMKESSPNADVNLRSDRDLLEEVLALTRSAQITKERQIERESRINPQAAYDLVNGFVKIILEIELFGDIQIAHKLTNELNSLLTPIKYIIRRDSPIGQRQKLTSMLNEAEVLLERRMQATSKYLVEKIGSNNSDEDVNGSEESKDI
jgi:hypothetical protein